MWVLDLLVAESQDLLSSRYVTNISLLCLSFKSILLSAADSFLTHIPSFIHYPYKPFYMWELSWSSGDTQWERQDPSLLSRSILSSVIPSAHACFSWALLTFYGSPLINFSVNLPSWTSLPEDIYPLPLQQYFSGCVAVAPWLACEHLLWKHKVSLRAWSLTTLPRQLAS